LIRSRQLAHPFGLPVYVARRPPALFCETPNFGGFESEAKRHKFPCKKLLHFCGSTIRPRRPSTFTHPSSKIRRSEQFFRYTEETTEKTGRPVGSVLTIEFEIDGQKFVALNGGPLFKLNEPISFVVNCEIRKIRSRDASDASNEEDRYQNAERRLRAVIWLLSSVDYAGVNTPNNTPPYNFLFHSRHSCVS
jgi:hypothetical protein